MFARHKNYEEISIAELQRKLDYANITLLFAFFLVIITLLIGFYVSSSQRAHIDLEEETITKKSTSQGNQINISAEVLLSGGYKFISGAHDSNTYSVFGNYENGFLFLNRDNGEIIYKYPTIPGDGILVSIPKAIINIIFIPYF